jgi:hypothetical protein
VVVTIDVASRDDAALLAASLPGPAETLFIRGYGMVRLRAWKEREIPKLLPIISECVERHGIRWARVRFDDEERIFRARKPASGAMAP